jgi:hypothetical protein
MDYWMVYNPQLFEAFLLINSIGAILQVRCDTAGQIENKNQLFFWKHSSRTCGACPEAFRGAGIF